MKTPDSQQIQAIQSPVKHVLCIAGPGSGKTFVLTERIRYTCQTFHVEPSKMAVVTYTNAAANEISERLGFEVGYLGTLHGLCMRLINDNLEVFGYSGKVTVIDEEHEKALIETTAAELGYKGSWTDIVRNIGAVFYGSHLGDKAAMVALRFERALKVSNLITYDLILKYALSALESGELLHGFTHLFVDEYQDAAAIDHMIYTTLGCEFVFVVGDPDQAIYGFRGGDSGIVLNMSTSGRWHVAMLENNYRSARTICSAAQSLIDRNVARVAKETVPVTESVGVVYAREFACESSELAWLADTIERREPRDVAVLCRYNAQVETISEHLSGLGIKVNGRTVNLPHDWSRTRALLALASDPQNNELASHYLSLTKGPRAAQEAARAAAIACQSINECAIVVPSEIQLEHIPDFLASRDVSQDSLTLINKAMEEMTGSTIDDLIMAVAEVSPARAEDPDQVTVTTMHAAKGREWNDVFLPGFCQGVIPSGNDSRLEEDRRLAYVAMTRAKRSLFISSTRSRFDRYKKRLTEAQASQFIDEAGLCLKSTELKRTELLVQ